MQLLKRTNQSAARERGIHGQSVLDLHQQLAGIVTRRTGREEFAAFLAKPSRNQATGEILWYTPLSGPIRNWNDLTEEERIAVQPKVDSALAAIIDSAGGDESFAAALGHDPDTKSCRYAPSSLFLVGDVPVLTEWGVEAVDGSTAQVTLTNTVAALPQSPPPPAPPPPPPVAPMAAAAIAQPERRWPTWLWPLLLLLFLLLLASALLRGCAPLGLNGMLAQPEITVPATDVAEEEALRREIAELGRSLEQRAETCLAETRPQPEPELTPEPVPAPVPEPPPEVAQDESERLQREGADVGEVNVSLMWNNFNDLDLAVIDSFGDQINFNRRSSPSGGRLDVDMNANSRSRTPIENISWPAGKAPPGTYRVLVALYDVKERSNAPTPFTVTVTVMGQRTVHQGVLQSNQRRRWIPITEFTVR